MSKRVEDILREKLLDGAPGNDIQAWDRLRDSLTAADREERRKKYVYFLHNAGRYAAIGAVILSLALMTNKFNDQESNNMVAGMVEETVGVTRDFEEKTIIREQKVTVGDKGDLRNENIIQAGKGDQLADDISFFSAGTDPLTEKYSDISDNDITPGIYTVSIPDLPVLSDLYPAAIKDSGLYDLEDYLREFQELYCEDRDMPDKSWKLSMATDVLSVTGDRTYLSYYNTSMSSSGDGSLLSFLDINGYKSRLANEGNRLLACDGGWLDYQIYNKLEHDLPVSVVLNLNRSIGKRWGAGTGLVYTFLGTSGVDLTPENPVYFEQSVQYLGLPLFLYYSLLPERSGWFIDLKAGFTANKPISVKGTQITWVDGIKESEPVHYLMTSDVMISYNVGISFGRTIIGNLKIFAEPSFSDNFHFIYQPLTFISERPASFNLQAGFRYDF